MPFFAPKKINVVETIAELADNLKMFLSLKDKEADKLKRGEKSGELDRNLRVLHTKLHESDASSEVVAQLCHEIYKTDLLPLLIKALPLVEFENRKDVIEITSFLLHRKVGVRMPTVDYVLSKPDETIFELVKIYPNPDSALHVGLLLRDFAKNEEICRLMLFSDMFYDLFVLVESPVFDIATDAFSTMREFLIKHTKLASEYLQVHFEKFFDQINSLISSENYVTKRQSLKLLGEIILESSNYDSMIKYVDSPDNLKLIMNLIRNKSSSIQFEAFHIFKVFVANPSKPQAIINILLRNQSKLIEFFLNFQPLKESDNEQFTEEKEYVVKCISQLPN